MIKDVNGRFDDYSILSKIRQILLHWGYELVENDLLWVFFFIYSLAVQSLIYSVIISLFFFQIKSHYSCSVLA